MEGADEDLVLISVCGQNDVLHRSIQLFQQVYAFSADTAYVFVTTRRHCTCKHAGLTNDNVVMQYVADLCTGEWNLGWVLLSGVVAKQKEMLKPSASRKSAKTAFSWYTIDILTLTRLVLTAIQLTAS